MSPGLSKAPRRPELPAWTVRLAEPEDLAFVYDSWLKSAAKTYPNMHAMDFFADERARAQHLVERSVVAVADVGGEAGLLGHVVYGKWRGVLAVHYAFVKPDARRAGVLISMLSFANFEKLPVVLTAPAQDERVMSGLVKRYIYDQRVQVLMRRGER